MGTSGNNPGYKVFSISTTIRNPRRNTEFLEVLKNFDNEDLTNEVKDNIYYELIKHGIYKFNKLDSIIKEKYKNGVVLSDEEIKRIIDDNPQKTGDEGRVMTQIRALKDTGLVSLGGNRAMQHLKITKLGKALIDGYDSENVYTKAMVGLHANNPQRTTIYNKSRPFLNTLFVINEINQHYESNKGILWHEFAAFILPMKDCDYEKTAKDIIDYREKFGHKINQSWLENYMFNIVGVNRIQFRSILKDYADDVFRKFDMTGLLVSSGFRENTYIRFNEYNDTKVKSILKEYAGYKFQSFSSDDEYYDYLYEINLPWEESEEVKKEIIISKQKILGVTVNSEESLDQQLSDLDSIHNKRIFDSSVEEFEFNLLKNELLLLSRNRGDESEFKDVPEPVRLEWLVALITAKRFGSKYIKPNLSLDEKGIPKSFATGGMADIEFISEKLYCLIEVTLQQDYKQQLNSETTSISDHLKQLDTDKEKCSLLIAPRIHDRVAEFFVFVTMFDQLMITAMTIEYYVDMVNEDATIDSFADAIKEMNNYMCQRNVEEKYCDYMNRYRATA